MKDRGIDALINDSLVGLALTFGAYLNGLLCSIFGIVYLKATAPAYNADGDYTPVIVLFSFLIGLQAGLALSQALEGGVSTIFVCLGEDPAMYALLSRVSSDGLLANLRLVASSLAERSPALFEEVRRNYPRVVEGVPYNGA